MLFYLGYFTPFKGTFYNVLEIFNEVCIVIIGYHLFGFTDFVPDLRIQYKIGYSAICITSTNILVNLIILLYKGVIGFKKRWPVLKRGWRLAKGKMFKS